MPGAEAIVAALAGTLARRARSGRAASRARVALVHGRVSIVERLVPAASSGTLSCANDRASDEAQRMVADPKGPNLLRTVQPSQLIDQDAQQGTGRSLDQFLASPRQ